MKVSIDEARQFIEGTKLVVGIDGEKVINKLNAIFGTEDPLPDYPFVYIQDGKHVWGSSPRKFQASPLRLISVDELLNLELAEPAPEVPEIVTGNWYVIPVKSGRKMFLRLANGRFVLIACRINDIYEVHVLSEHFIARMTRDCGYCLPSQEDIEWAKEELRNSNLIISEDVELYPLRGGRYYFLVPNWVEASFTVMKRSDVGESIDNYNFETENYFYSSKEAEGVASHLFIGVKNGE